MTIINEKFLNVNQHGVLRIPMDLWLALVFLIRHWIIIIFTVSSAAASQLDGFILFGTGGFPWIALAMELPAAIVFWLFLQRTPEAGNLVRKLWPRARLLLTITATFHMTYLIWYLWMSSYWLPWPELFLASFGIIDLAIIYGIYSSNYIKTIFNEFPASKTYQS